MIILITGPSGAGKSTFVARLMTGNPDLAFSVSATTRPRRPGEQDGREYDFLDDEGFDALLARNAFVEWAHVHDHRYGTTRRRLDELVSAGKTPLLDIDVQGGVQVIDLYGGQLVSVFLFPPSWEELERRLRVRGTDQEDAIQRRLQTARKEVQSAGRYRYWIVNDDVDQAVVRMQAILTAEHCRREAFARPPLS